MKASTTLAAVVASVSVAAAQSSATVQESSASVAAGAAPTEVVDCHLHGQTPFCFAGEDEWELESDFDIDALPGAYTECHTHGTGELHCESPQEVTLVAATTEAEEDHEGEQDHDHGLSNSTADVTEVTGCHAHDDTLYCFAGGDEWEVQTNVDASSAPEAYTDCHAHGDEELHCSSPETVTLAATADHSEDHADGEEDHTHSTTSSGETTTESQPAGNLASGAEVSKALVMLGAAFAALYAF